MYNKNINYSCDLEVTIEDIVTEFQKKYNVDRNQAAYALNQVLSQDSVACILLDRGFVSVGDYLRFRYCDEHK